MCILCVVCGSLDFCRICGTGICLECGENIDWPDFKDIHDKLESCELKEEDDEYKYLCSIIEKKADMHKVECKNKFEYNIFYRCKNCNTKSKKRRLRRKNFKGCNNKN